MDAAERVENHNVAAERILALAVSQIDSAKRLGWVARGFGMDHTDNPFTGKFTNKSLEDAWNSGWVMGNEGIGIEP